MKNHKLIVSWKNIIQTELNKPPNKSGTTDCTHKANTPIKSTGKFSIPKLVPIRVLKTFRKQEHLKTWKNWNFLKARENNKMQLLLWKSCSKTEEKEGHGTNQMLRVLYRPLLSKQ